MPGQDLAAKLREFRPAMVDGRMVDRAQDAIRHVGRSGDLQEVAAAAGRCSNRIMASSPRIGLRRD